MRQPPSRPAFHTPDGLSVILVLIVFSLLSISCLAVALALLLKILICLFIFFVEVSFIVRNIMVQFRGCANTHTITLDKRNYLFFYYYYQLHT